MSYKWIGAMLVILGCGGTGFSISAAHRREESSLRELLTVLEYIESELQFRLTPLPELCRLAAREATGGLRYILEALVQELESQTAPDACNCMSAVINQSAALPVTLRRLLLQLGHTLGRFDLNGQLRGLQAVQKSCELELKKCRKNRDLRLRSYQTLGLCAGTALAILFV